MKKLIIFGASSFAEIAHSYFAESEFEIIAHLVDSQFLPTDFNTLLGAPIYAMESPEGEAALNEASHFYVASTYTKMNRVRREKYEILKAKGLQPASYISPHAFIDKTAKLGEHLFIFENNVIQYGSTIEDNCVLWSGNHIGHHSTIHENVFVSSHVVVSGHSSVGRNTFLGVNCSIYNNISIGADNWIAPNCVIDKSTPDNSLYKVKGTEVHPVAPLRFFKVEDK